MRDEPTIISKIEWDDSYSVGVLALDEQHKTIIRQINLLLANSQADVRSKVISDTLNALTRYSSEHFREEERLLEKHGYPDLEEQKKDHQQYRLRVMELCFQATDRHSFVPGALLRFLTQWWTLHILESDMEYRPFLEQRGVR